MVLYLGENSYHHKVSMSRQTRIVVKLGTQVVVDHASGLPARTRLNTIVGDLATLKRAGHEVIMVSSGAVGMGRQALAIPGALDLPLKQACAAVGQSQLMALYALLCKEFGIIVAQVLVTAQDFTNREGYLNLRNSCEQLLSLGTLPIFNENDVVSTAGIRERGPHADGSSKKSFDDNDKLSALVAGKLSAEILVILTNVDGVYTDNPFNNPEAVRIERISTIEHLATVSCAGKSSLGRGGMSSKLEAAKIAGLCGVKTIIASADGEAPISAALSGTAGTTIDLGTRAATSLLSGRERWFGLSSGFAGVVTIDSKARAALERGPHSLLPVGVTKVEGDFSVGDIVSVIDEQGEEVGRGITSQSSVSLRAVAGKRTQEARGSLTSQEKDEVIHRDNLVVYRECHDDA